MSLAETRDFPATAPNDLSAFWVPFTPNRAFKKAPRFVTRAKDMHYFTPDGRAIMDGSAGMWCTNAGHNRDSITQAIQQQAAELDYAPPFQFAIRKRSNWRAGSRRWRPATSTTCSSPIRARKRSTPR